MRIGESRQGVAPFRRRRRPATGNRKAKATWEEARAVLDSLKWNVSATARHFGVSEKAVRKWITRNYAEKTLTQKRGRRRRKKVHQIALVRAMLQVHTLAQVAKILRWTPEQRAYVEALGLDKNDETK